jgi:hypothetical protein
MMFHYSVGESGFVLCLILILFLMKGGGVRAMLCVSILSLLYLQLVRLFRQINITMIFESGSHRKFESLTFPSKKRSFSEDYYPDSIVHTVYC